MEFIDVFSFILTRIMLGLLSPGSAKTCWVRWKIKYLFNSQLCQKYFCQIILNSANLYFKLRSIMSGMFFSGVLFISTHILLDLLSLGSAEAYNG